MRLSELNQLSPEKAREELLRCCGASRWASRVADLRPFADFSDVVRAADQVWSEMGEKDWREAFDHHPRIGASSANRWASQEQKGTAQASEATLQALVRGNQDYEKRFGHIFLVCATGKSADEMLAILQARLKNPPPEELRIAAGEQAKITRLRLEKLLK